MDLEEEDEEVLQWRKKMLLAFWRVFGAHLTDNNNHYWVFALLPSLHSYWWTKTERRFIIRPNNHVVYEFEIFQH